MFLATINPSICKITRTLPSRTVLNNGKFYTFDNGSCQLFTQTGYLNTTDAGVTNYYYFPNNDGCGSGVATYFTGSEWTNLNSWNRVDGQIPELLPFNLSTVIVTSSSIPIIKSNSGSVPRVNCLCLCGAVNCIAISANNISLASNTLPTRASENCGTLFGSVSGTFNNYGTVCATGSQLISMAGSNFGFLYADVIGNFIQGITNNGLISGNLISSRFNNGIIISKSAVIGGSFGVSTGIFCSSDSISFQGTCNSGVICLNPSIEFYGTNFANVCTTGIVSFLGAAVNMANIYCSNNINFYNSSINCGNIYTTGIVGFTNGAVNRGIVSGLTCFFVLNINYCCIIGNAYFDFNATNCGTVSGTGYFRNLASNCGIVTCACLY